MSPAMRPPRADAPSRSGRGHALWLALVLTAGLSGWRAAPAAPTAAPTATPQAGRTIQLGGPGPYHQLTLPLAAQAASQRDDLGDLRILNARGEPLPHAWARPPGVTAVLRQHQLPLFRWGGPRTPPVVDAASMPRQSPSAPSWPLWIADLRQVRGTVHRLQLTLPPQSAGLFAVAVESSDDFQSWRTERASAPLGILAHDRQTLRQETIELDGVHAAYLRLRLLPGSAEPDLRQLEVTSSEDSAVAPPLSWSAPIRPTACNAQACDYPVPPHVSLHRLKVLLTEQNTLISLAVLSQPPAGTAARPIPDDRRRLRDRLRALRDKGRHDPGQPSPTSDATHWQWLTEGQVHWIDQPGAPQRAEELDLPPATHKMLRLSGPGHEAASWTRRPPAIQVATGSRTVVFLAQGPPPYRLQWAGPAAPPADLPMAQLRPAAADAGSLPSPAMLTASPGKGAHTVASAPTAAQPPSGPAAASPAPLGGIPKAWWLWAALLAGVALMAGMAWSLLSSPRAASGSDERGP